MKRFFTSYIKLFMFVFLSIIFLTIPGFARTPVPERTDSWVNDYAGIVDEGTKKYLEEFISSVEQKTPDSIEIIIATFRTLEGWELMDFVTAYGEKWRMGRRTRRDNGVVLVVLANGRRVTIGVGQNLRGIITDPVIADIIQNVILPEFRKGNYSEGIKKFAEAVAKMLLEAEIPRGNPLLPLMIIALALSILAILLFIRHKTR